MNIFRTVAFRALAFAVALSGLALLPAGCDVDSTDSTTAVVSDNDGNIYNYSGLYMSDNNEEGSTTGYSPLVVPAGRQSGTMLTWLRLLQYGSALEAYDNAGLTWFGDVTVQNGKTASFSLRGKTTAGADVEIAGTLSYVDQESTMDAAWVEPSFSGSIFAKATVSPVVTNSPMSINPKSASFNKTNETKTFSVTGGSGPYDWVVESQATGTVAPKTGPSTVYTCRESGNNTITVTDANGNTASAQITFASSKPTNLTISPSSWTLSAANFSYTLTASGGTGTYAWMVLYESLGTLSSTTGSSVTYTSKKTNGVNTVTVRDDSNASASATVTYSN